MKVSKSRISYLLKAYSDGEASEGEEQELFDWVAKGDEIPIKKHIEKLVASYNSRTATPIVDWEKLYNNIVEEKNNRNTEPVVRKMIWTHWAAAAAAVLLLLGTGYYFLHSSYEKQKDLSKNERPKINDITAPNSVNAFITLSNGQKITLDSASNGTLAQQGNVSVIKLSDGKIAYHPDAALDKSDGELMYNTLTNPAGSKVVNITLEDGTRVWLNAKSSLRYPTVFTGSERKVEISGEAYFEVAHLSLPNNGKEETAMPFHVDVRGVDVKVLGTHFNINGYDDEVAIKTTLLEGSVKITTASSSKMIKPGEQAQVTPLTGESINIITPDLSEVMAWKNGEFSYTNSDLETIMRQMARWYNVEVVYRDRISDHYTVNVSDNVPVSQLFKFIEMSGGVHFEIVGKKILVTK
ncbi:MAG: FecR domain-containing protein [Ginsengibacter sp.]